MTETTIDLRGVIATSDDTGFLRVEHVRHIHPVRAWLATLPRGLVQHPAAAAKELQL